MQTKTYSEALDKLRTLCAKQEKSPSDALRLMKKWGVNQEASVKILGTLKSEGFISEKRYAEAFVKDKIRFEHWGRVKVLYSLTHKGIPRGVAEDAIAVIDGENYRSMIRNELIRKRKLMNDDASVCWQKLARFGTSRGYEMDIMYDILNEICSSSS